ncbi:hypothetical protein [Flavobacterium granuli]|uniref:Carboxypeptidase regulatory-like domain-containing protein n=1 Tax=Flavobacterium granuli TaxID=280093 RepID=A0ABU1S2C3_9FLAO|nr:hypothetical protein [Flavobacterium granuli]MDR6845182.1 hypothetical protein [Flavobacterium granuli]
MKKIILVAFIALGIVSCSSEDDSPEDISGINTATVTAKIGVGKDAFPGTTGKNVNRGTIPTTINTITVDVVNNNPAIPSNQTIFDLVGSGGANQFLIENVASGSNTFTAKATTTGTPKLTVEPYNHTNDATTDAMLKGEKDAVPYAKYEAVVGMSITLGTPQEIVFPLLTNHGRIIGTVETAALLSATDRRVEVIAERFYANNTPVLGPITIDLTGNKSVIAAWNDDTAVKGNYMKYIVNVYGPDGLTIEKTFNKTITIIESTGITSKITITNDGLTESINYGTFTIPAWTEISQ